MANHTTKQSKENPKSNQSNKETQALIQIEEEVGASNDDAGVSNGVNKRILFELSKMNAKMENMLGCLYQMLNDKKKEMNTGLLPTPEPGGAIDRLNLGNNGLEYRGPGLDYRNEGYEFRNQGMDFQNQGMEVRNPHFNGGFRELPDVGRREYKGEIENQNFQSKFDSQFQCSSMESETLRHTFMANLNIRCDSEASRHYPSIRSSENLEAKIQAMWNLVKFRSQIGDEDPIIAGFHGASDKPEVQLSEHADFGEYMVVVETEDVLVEAEVILVDEELENASNGMNCGAANAIVGAAIVGAEVGTDCTIVASNKSVDIAGDKDAPEVFGESWSATGKMDLMNQIPSAESYNGGFIPNIGLLEVQLMNEDFEDPFDVPPNSVQTQKIQLVLSVGIAMSLVEINCWLVLVGMVYMEEMRVQAKSVAGIGVQWWRRGVG